MSLAPVYVICSDDPFLRLQKSNEIIALAKKELPDAEFMLFTAQDFGSNSPNLSILENELLDPGLFATNKIIKIYFEQINNITVSVMQLLAKRSRAGVTTIVELPRVSVKTKDAAAKPYQDKLTGSKAEDKLKQVFGFLKNINSQIELLYPPEGKALYLFIQNLANSYSLKLSPEITQLLIDCNEGNLGAIDQVFKTITLTTEIKEPSLVDIRDFINQDPRFATAEFANAILQADSKKALLVLHALLEANSEKLQTMGFIVGSLDSCLKAILALREDPSKASYPQKVGFFASLKLFNPQTQNLVIRDYKNIPLILLDYLLEQCAQVNHALRNFALDEALMALERIAVATSDFKVMKIRAL